MKNYEKYCLFMLTAAQSLDLLCGTPDARNTNVSFSEMPLMIIATAVFLPFALRWALKKNKKD